MADRFKFAEVRQKVIDIMKMDLLGPSSEEEVLSQNPRFEYLVGMLAPQTNEDDGSNEQEVDGDASFEGDDNYTAGEEDDNEPVSTNRFKTPSSIGISFYVESSTSGFNVDVSWGDYVKSTDKTVNKDGKEINVNTYTRHPQKETIAIELASFSKSQEYPLVCDSNVVLYISKIGLRQGYTLVTAYVINRRKNSESDIAGLMFQVKLHAYSPSGENIFFAEHICRKILAVDEFYFAQRPILGRGRGCAATWIRIPTTTSLSVSFPPTMLRKNCLWVKSLIVWNWIPLILPRLPELWNTLYAMQRLPGIAQSCFILAPGMTAKLTKLWLIV